MDHSPRGALRACSKATRDGTINAVQQWVAGNPEEKILLDLERARMEREDFRDGNAPVYGWTSHDGKLESVSWSKYLRRIMYHASKANDALRNIKTALRNMLSSDVPMDLIDHMDLMEREIDAVLGESSDEEGEA